MNIDKNAILELLRSQGQPDKAAEADGALPDQVDTDRDQNILERLGINPADLLGMLGGQGGGAGDIAGKLGGFLK